MPTGYREIAAHLRESIETGEYPPGARIPTEQALCEQYGVARATVRRALDLLKHDGLLATATSQGTYVPYPPVRLAIARYGAVTNPDRPRNHLGPWETACAEQGVDGGTELLAVDQEAADAMLAARLDVEPGDVLVHRARRMTIGGQTAQIQDTWMPAALVDGTPLAGAGKVIGGVYAVMASHGFGPDRVTEEVRGRTPTGDERRRMDLGDGGMVLEVWRTTWDQAGRVVEVLRTVADARLSSFVYDNLPVRRSEG